MQSKRNAKYKWMQQPQQLQQQQQQQQSFITDSRKTPYEIKFC